MRRTATCFAIFVLCGLGVKEADARPAHPPATVRHALQLAHVVYGMPYGQALRVSWCESRWSSRAKNRSSTASGLFQFLDSTWRATPYRHFSPFDPHANALAAGWLWKRAGWRPWSCGWAA